MPLQVPLVQSLVYFLAYCCKNLSYCHCNVVTLVVVVILVVADVDFSEAVVVTSVISELVSNWCEVSDQVIGLD